MKLFSSRGWLVIKSFTFLSLLMIIHTCLIVFSAQVIDGLKATNSPLAGNINIHLLFKF